MSNAMRSGKRLLAGVAAGALAAGAMVFATAPAANATVSTITLNNAGLTVVDPAGSQTAGFTLGIALSDASGAPVALSGETISAQITSWPATNYARASMIQLSAPGTAIGSTDETAARTIPVAANAAATQYAMFINGAGATGEWDNVAAGDYNVRVTVTTTATGATVTKNFPVKVYASTVSTPPGSINFTDVNGRTSVDALSYAGNSAANGTFAYYKMLDANGYAMIVGTGAGIFTNSLAVATSADRLVTTTGGFAYPTTPGIYRVTPTNVGTWAPGNNAYDIQYNTPTPTTASLPITVSTNNTNAATSTVLNTTPNLAGTGIIEYIVPSGTTSLSFTTTGPSANAGTTVPWRVETDAAGGASVPSAGVASISSGGTWTVNVTINAASAANGQTIDFITGTGGGQTQTTVRFDDLAPTLTVGSPIVGKVGEPVTVTGTLLDQFDRPLKTASLVAISRTTPSALANLDSKSPAADGSFSLTIPASAAPAAAATYGFQVTGSSGGANAAPANISVNYTATGGITALAIATTPVSTSGQVPAVTTPTAGTVVRNNTSTTVVNPANVTQNGTIPAGVNATTTMTFTSTPNTTISVSGSEGVFFSATTGAVPVAWNSGLNSTSVGSGGTLTVWTTKSGVNTVTATAGDKTVTQTFYAYVATGSARNVAITPATSKVGVNAFTNLTVKVTDAWGNAVPGVSVGQGTAVFPVGAVTVLTSLAGGGGIPVGPATTTAAGEATVSYTSPNATGQAAVTATGTATLGQFGTAITGIPAPSATATATITVEGSESKSIVIAGERTTVSGKPGIIVDGATKGFDVGSKMVPNVRFPGQTEFTAGSARPTTSVAGDFTWQRKTGKKTTVFFSNEAGDVRSNRVIIPAN